MGEDVTKKKAEEFSETNWREVTKKVMVSIDRLTDKKWTKILSAATAATTVVQTTPQLCRTADVDTEDARATAYEADSE